MKVHHLDFQLSEDKCRKLVLRFYPMRSYMHSFDDEPPKSLQSVYKVYYAWAILQYWKNRDGTWKAPQRVFEMMCDECSALEHLEYVIRRILRTKKRRTQAMSYGQPGSMWTIIFHPHYYWDDSGERKLDVTNGVLVFEVFDSWSDVGFRFNLEISEALQFCEYLHRVNQHMLENGDPI